MNAKEAFDVARQESGKEALGQAILCIQEAARSGATSVAISVPDLARAYVHTELKNLGYTVRYSDENVLVRWTP